MHHDGSRARHAEAAHYHAVALALGGERIKISRIRCRCGSWESAWHTMRRYGAPPPDPWEALENLRRQSIGFSLSSDPDHPARVREIPEPPFGLYYRADRPLGEIARNAQNTVAIVGTRRATPEGKKIAFQIARNLTRSGFAIISGLAFGIDTAAHEGCLEAKGTAIAILAGGLDGIYPRSNEKIAKRILSGGGTVVSEYPPGVPPLAHHFIERNRLIAGMARGVIIVEAPVGSGSLATARFALEANREVFVVPGSTLHPNFAGSHALIRQGAELITSAEEVLLAYGVDPGVRTAREIKDASPQETLILEALQRISGPAPVDKIVAVTKLEPRIVNQALSFLLLREIIKESAEGYTI